MLQLLKNINWVDIFALILLIRICYVSSHVGVGKQILPLALLVLILIITLYYYERISALIIDRFGTVGSLAEFLCFLAIALFCSIVYKVATRIIGGFLQHTWTESGSIERAGGTIMGIMRSTVIIGMVIIGMALIPVRFVRTSVRESYLGPVFAGINFTIYDSLAGLIFRTKQKSPDQMVKDLMSKERDGLFQARSEASPRQSGRR